MLPPACAKVALLAPTLVAHVAPLDLQALSRVEVDGKVVAADAIASEVLTAKSCRVELFDASVPPRAPMWPRD